MDKGDWALLISLASFFAAAGSAYYSRRLAIQDAKKMARKTPILAIETARPLTEFRSHRDRPGGFLKEYPGYFVTEAVVRNCEADCGVRVVSIHTKRGVSVADRKDLTATTQETPWDEQWLLDDLPAPAFKNRLPLGFNLGPAGTQARVGAPGDSKRLYLYAKRELKPADLSLQWEWLDGQKA